MISPRSPGPRLVSVKMLERWKIKTDKLSFFIGTLLIPWDLDRPNQIRTLYDPQYCYRFNYEFLAFNEETLHYRNYVNLLKRDIYNVFQQTFAMEKMWPNMYVLLRNSLLMLLITLEYHEHVVYLNLKSLRIF